MILKIAATAFVLSWLSIMAFVGISVAYEDAGILMVMPVVSMLAIGAGLILWVIWGGIDSIK